MRHFLWPHAHSHFTEFIPFWQTSDLENARLQAEARGGVGGDGKGKRKKGAASNAAQRARISRESKLLPNLIFSIEHMERQLVQLAKATKVRLFSFMPTCLIYL